MIVYLGSKPLFDISVFEAEYMLKNKDIEYVGGKYRISKEGSFKYIFSNKIKPFKKVKYLRCIATKKFICEDCGKPHSYNIRPAILEDGTIDFKVIVCVCKSCRTKALEKKDILVPAFKQRINWRNEIKRINEEINIYGIEDPETYMVLSKEILNLNLYNKLILPKKKKYLTKFEQNWEEQMINYKNSLEEELGTDIDLSIYENRAKIRRFLYKENNGRCPVCGKKTNINDFTIDHIVAKKLGGKNCIDNFVGMCMNCNLNKGHKTVLGLLASIELNKMPNRILDIAQEQQKQSKEKINDYQRLLEDLRKHSKKHLELTK